MSKLKVLIIGTTDNQGGAASVGWDLGHELIKRGYSVKYIVGYKKSTKNYVYELHKPVITKWLDQHTRYNATGIYRHLIAYFTANNIDSGASLEILKHPWYQEADIVHCHNLHGNYFKLDTLKQIASEKKLVWTLHDMSAITGKCAFTEDPAVWSDGYHPCRTLNAYPPMLWDHTRYMWYKKQDIYHKIKSGAIVTPSLWLQKIVKDSMLKHLPTYLIYNGVDIDLFQPMDKLATRKKLHLPLDKKIIMFAAQGGQKDPRKGWVYVEEIMRHYSSDKNIHFISIGSGKEATLHDNLTTLPYLNKNQLSQYYNAADIFLFTSLAENCPLVVLEAMACGLPVVSFDVGGVKELVTHKTNGYIAKYKDGEDLSVGLKWAFNLTEKELDKLCKANREKVIEKYSIAKMTDQYEKLYIQLARSD